MITKFLFHPFHWLMLVSFAWKNENFQFLMSTFKFTLSHTIIKVIPGDFITKVKQINSQSDLISMSSFAGPSYLTTWSSICIILIWDLCICKLANLCQTDSSWLHTSETSPAVCS